MEPPIRRRHFAPERRQAAISEDDMKKFLFAMAVSALPFEAEAISRYNSTSMSCAQIQATIRSEGAAIMRWRSPQSGVQRYNRFVAHGGFCPTAERAERAFIPSADRQSCPVWECRQYSPDDRDFFWIPRR
jgi:hypothetical protein